MICHVMDTVVMHDLTCDFSKRVESFEFDKKNLSKPKKYAKFEIFLHFLRFCGAFFKFGNFVPSSKKAYNLTHNAPFEVAIFGNKS